MTNKDTGDTKTLFHRCLLITFKEKKHRKSEEIKVEKDGVKHEAVITGKELFEDFIAANKDCYWNPHLEESVRNIKYVGCLHTHTILLGGRDIYLDTLRSAWGRKSLRPPGKFIIHRVGEVNSVQMHVLPQNHFTPLPEALCLIINDLNRAKSMASLDAIQERLRELYKGMQVPSEPVIYEALDSLLKERKIYHTGSGYGIVTPDMFQQPLNGHVMVQDHHLVIQGGSGTDGLPGGGATIYIPLPNASNPSEMRSISCQTSNSPERLKDIDEDKEGFKEEKGSKNKLERSFSMREKKSKGDKKVENSNFSRSSSMRFSDEKAKSMVKDINLKTSDAHKDKDKGAKQSMIKKLFGRGKSNSKRTASTSEGDPAPAQAEEKEYATFSAQFPPPDWQLYEHQVNQALAITAAGGMPGQQVSRSATWHNMRPPRFDASMQSDMDIGDPEYSECPLHKSRTMPPQMGGFSPEEMFPGRPRCRSSSSQSSRSSSYQELPGSPTRKMELCEPAVKHRRPRKHSRRKSSDRHSKHLPPAILENGETDVRPKRSSKGHQLDDVDRGILDESGLYQDINDIPPPPIDQGDPNIIDNPFHGNVHRHKPSQKTKIFKKYREMHCTSFCNNDITIEYCGKLPKKDTGYSMSRDSGVNCVGLNPLTPADFTPKPLSSCITQDAPQQRSSTPVQLNNQQTTPVQPPNNLKFIQTTFNNDSANTITVHTAQVHGAGPGPVTEISQEDSGFNSPRTADLADSFANTTTVTTPQATKIDYQRNWTSVKPNIVNSTLKNTTIGPPNKSNATVRNVNSTTITITTKGSRSSLRPCRDVSREDLAKSKEQMDLTTSTSTTLSNSSHQTVKEAPKIQNTSPPKDWKLPRPLGATRYGKVPPPPADIPREGEPAMLNDQEYVTEQTDRQNLAGNVVKDREHQLEQSDQQRLTNDIKMRETFMNGDVKIKPNDYTNHKDSKSRNHKNVENKHTRPLSGHSRKSLEDKDKVKRNLGDALENLQDTRLHHKAFREYHNGKHANGNVVQQANGAKDYEVVGIV